MFSFHSELSLTSLCLLCCDPGAGSSSRTSTLRSGYCCLESISSPLDLHLSFSSESSQSIFIPTVLWPLLFLTTLSVTKPALCFLPLNVMRMFLPAPVSLGGASPAGDWLELVSGEVFRLMPDGSVKLAIISTA